ncbi:hypothetical protein E9531_13785 [Lampropedia puyangensis]|uniref:Uncharacterized protein n=1 Tax=Lampropedia puyangensis TaxID=1330072 RepID=A0A4S8EYJ6_9BURK|nr:hypothetical protein [Lampropedia puyangensis]THT98743.1 hypothetical protein E9531_13785 [Lampropedia puyangensis]
MTVERNGELSAAQAKLDRILQLQQAIEQASEQVHMAETVQPQEQKVMLRILAQRRRWSQREAQRHWNREERNAVTSGFSVGARERSAQNRSLHQGELAQALPLVGEVQAFAFKHPVAVGLALGVSLVVGPKRIFKTALWMAPLMWRGWSMAQRMRGTLGERR